MEMDELKPVIRALVTGAAGQIAYSLIHSIGKGDAFGTDQPVILHLLDIPPMLGILEGIVMEIKDCAFSMIQEVVLTTQEEEAFKGVDACFLVGAMPRKEGMERKDLFSANVKIFKAQGKALEKNGNKDCKVLVVGNPANTNAFICSYFAPSIPKENFTAMTRLDQNRAQAQLSERLHVPMRNIHGMVIWGNQSNTQFPDASKATYRRGNIEEEDLVSNGVDSNYLSGDFVTNVQQRAAKVINARKLSAAMSAAKAAADHMHDWWFGTQGSVVSMAVFTNEDNPYKNTITEGLFFGFPCTVDENRNWTVKDGYNITDGFAKDKILKTLDELEDEKKEALHICQANE